MSEANHLTVDSARFAPLAKLNRLQGMAFAFGLGGAALSGFGLAVQRETFFHAYLVAWLLWLGVAMGLFALGMLNHVSGGLWGVMMRRVSEAAGKSLPLFALLAVPIVLGMHHLYPWMDAEQVAASELLQHKQIYLNYGFFLVRLFGTLALWWVLALFLARWSRQQDETGDPATAVKMQRLSALGLVLYVLTGTLASVDWIMSLDPQWFSSLHGVGFVVGHGLSGFAFIVAFMLLLSQGRPFEGVVKPKLFHDYGKLMLAFVMLWAYMMVSQYLIIWSGNLPEEVGWYIHRNTHGWKALSVLLVVGQFFLPFLVLLSRDIKVRPRLLILVAGWILLMRWFDLFWQVAPNFGQDQKFHWLHPATALGVGGLWVAILVILFKGRPALPVHDPILKEAMDHG